MTPDDTRRALALAAAAPPLTPAQARALACILRGAAQAAQDRLETPVVGAGDVRSPTPPPAGKRRLPASHRVVAGTTGSGSGAAEPPVAQGFPAPL